MNKAFNTYLVNTLDQLLSLSCEKRASGIASVSEAKDALFNVKLLLALLYERKGRFPQTETGFFLQCCLSGGFACPSVIDAYSKHHEIFDLAVDSLFAHGLPSSSFYQQTATIEIAVRKNALCLIQTKIQRDASGSYYTPADFARAVTEEAFNLLDDFDPACDCCVDFSCGAGDFLISAYHELVKRGADPSDAFNCIWAYDVDPIALSIAACELIADAGLDATENCFRELRSRFHHGNPLLQSDGNAADPDIRISLFARGLLYDDRMGLPSTSFPDKGFKLILGNPPWEKIRLEERKFFNLFNEEIGRVGNKARRNELISALRTCDSFGITELYDELTHCFADLRKRIERAGVEATAGELNTYSLFTQLAILHLARNGKAALILKSALFTSPVHADFFASCLNGGNLEKIYFFENSGKIFPIDGRERFCVAFLASNGCGGKVGVSFGNSIFEDFTTLPLTVISCDDLRCINPGTGMLPDAPTSDSFAFLLRYHEALPVFKDVFANCHFGRLVHLTTHARWISRDGGERKVGIFEGKFIGTHDCRFSTFDGMTDAQIYAPKARARLMDEREKQCKDVAPRYFIDCEKWERISKNYHEPLMLCWRSLTSPTNARTMIAALSYFRPACQSVQFLQCSDPLNLVLMAGLFNSKAFDFFVRLKMPGIDLTQAIVNQVPCPPLSAYDSTIVVGRSAIVARDFIIDRVLSLYLNEPMLLDVFSTAGISFEPVAGNRADIINDLDCAFYQIYGFSSSDIESVESSFC